MGLGELEQLAVDLGTDQENIVLADLNANELINLGKVAKKLRDPKKRKKAVKKIETAKVIKSVTNNNKNMAFVETKETSGKVKFENRFSKLSPHIQVGLKKNAMQIVDRTIYVTKYVGGKTNIDAFQSGDKKQEGITNLLQGRLGANDEFLLTGMRVTSAEVADCTEANWEEKIKDADFGKLDPAIANGEFALLNEQTNYSDENASSCFKYAFNDNSEGIYILENPKLFKANKSVKVNFKFAGAPKAGTLLRVELIGVMTVQK